MRKCPFCDSEVADTVVLCRFCGETLGHATPAQAARGSSQVLTLVMGILALVCFPIGPLFGIVTVVLWAVHRGRVKRGFVKPDGLATAGFVIALVGILWQMLAVVAYVAYKDVLDEALAAETLMEAHKAQERYRQANGEYASDKSQLERYGLEDTDSIGAFIGYSFKLTSDGSEWSCVASPVEPDADKNRRRYLYINQTGVVRCSKTKDVGPDSPEYVSPGYHGTRQPPSGSKEG